MAALASCAWESGCRAGRRLRRRQRQRCYVSGWRFPPTGRLQKASEGRSHLQGLPAPNPFRSWLRAGGQPWAGYRTAGQASPAWWGGLTHPPPADSGSAPGASAVWTVTQAGAVFSLLACGSVEKIFHELLAPTLIFFFPLGHKVIGDHPSSSDGSGQAWALSAAPWRSEVRGSARPGAMFRHSPPSVKNSRQPVGGQ